MSKLIIKTLIFLGITVVSYSAFSPASSAVGTSITISGNVISVSNSDTITYKSGYYLVGSDWKPLTLSGSLFPGFNQWILDGATASIDITNDRAIIGNTTYVLTYGCNLDSTNTNWVCGDNANWKVTEISIPPPQTGDVSTYSELRNKSGTTNQTLTLVSATSPRTNGTFKFSSTDPNKKGD